MTERVLTVLKGFISLSPTEKEEFIREVNRYLNAKSWEKPDLEKGINESYRSIGPKNTICACCGR